MYYSICVILGPRLPLRLGKSSTFHTISAVDQEMTRVPTNLQTCECLLDFGGNFYPPKTSPFSGYQNRSRPIKGVPTGRINGSHFTFQTDFRNVFIFGVRRSCGTQQELTLFRNKTTVFRQTDKKHDVLNSVRHTTNCGKLSHCCSQHYSHPPEPESPCHPPILIFDQIGATGFFRGKLYWARPKHHPKLRNTGTKALERIRLQ